MFRFRILVNKKMGFYLKNRDTADVPSYEFVPSAALVPKIGLAMALTDGKLGICSGTTKPAYICDAQRDEAVAEDKTYPVFRVQGDMVFETENTAAFSSVKVGDKVTISEDGMGVTATTTGGVCEVVYISEEAKSDIGGKVLVRFVG